MKFQSTHPVRGATWEVSEARPFSDVFQSTHPVRGATPDFILRKRGIYISIHAPREGCDGGVAGVV